MAEKRSDNFMNFGPEWLQNLSQPQDSNTTSNSNTKPRPSVSSTKCQLAEYRYGREEMLALFDANATAPDYLVKHEDLYVANTQLPIALQSDIDEMRRYQQEPRGGISGPSVTLRSTRTIRDPGFQQDPRMRTRNFSTYTPIPDNNFPRTRTFRYFPDNRHGPGQGPVGDNYNYRMPNHGRAKSSYWRRDGPAHDSEPWRSNELYRPHNAHIKNNSRINWRDEEEKTTDPERRPQVRRTRKLNSEDDPGDAPCLPEWAESDNVGGYSGSFDATGAYTESNTPETKELAKDESPQPDEVNTPDEIPAEKTVDQLVKQVEEILITQEAVGKSVEPEVKSNAMESVVVTKVKEVAAEGKISPVINKTQETLQQESVLKTSNVPLDQQNTQVKPLSTSEGEENSQQNGCKGLADNINSLLNWVLDETGADDVKKPMQSNFPMEPSRGLNHRDVLQGAPCLDRRDVMLDLERMMKTEPRNAQQPPINLANIFQADMQDFNNANKLPKFLPAMVNPLDHFNPQASSAAINMNPNLMPLFQQQQLANEQTWSANDGLLGEMSLWNEHQMELAKQMALQRQQQGLLQNTQMNLTHGLVIPPQLPNELPETGHMNFPNFLNPNPAASFWDDMLQSDVQNAARLHTSFNDMCNYYLQNSNMPNRVTTEPLSVEDVYRNSLNFQLQNQLLNTMDSGLENTMGNVGRNDFLQLLQRHQQQQQMQPQQQPQQQMFIGQQPEMSLLGQQFPVEAHPPPPLNFLNIPPPPLPQPIPMPERRISQITNTVSSNPPVSGDVTATMPTVTSSEPPAPQVASVEEQPTKQDVSNFEVVKKKDKKAKKKGETESEKVKSEKKKITFLKPSNTYQNVITPNMNVMLEQQQQRAFQQQQQQIQLQLEMQQAQLEAQAQKAQQTQHKANSTGTKPKVSRPAPWLNQPQKDTTTTHSPQMSLSQIQRLEKEQQRKAQILQKAQAMTEHQQATQKEKESIPWVNLMTSSEEPKLSLLDIQYEERKQLMQAFNPPAASIASTVVAPPPPTNYAKEGIDNKLSRIGGIWGPPEPSTVVWNLANTQGNMVQHTGAIPKHSHVAVEEPKKQSQAPSVVEVEAPDELNNWAKEFLKNYEHKLDVEAFLSFIKNIESPYEVKEYIKFYLGETKETMDYCEEYIEKRLEINRRKNSVIPADDLSAPAVAINPAMNMDSQESKGKHKKTKKNRMSKIDSRILGFNVTAAADRFNIGDIDSIDKN